jgi:farnesyl-diphosphate farnesyltransferase
MHIRLAKTAGFCMGVRRAVEMIFDLAAQNGDLPLYTFGPLIHNTQVLELLRQKGVTLLERIPAQGQGTILIRAHGVPPDIKARLAQAGFQVRDATCLRVVKIQQIIDEHTRNGSEAIIIGDRDHPEVFGLQGYAHGRGHVIENLEEFQNLPVFQQAFVVMQSTQNMALFNSMRHWVQENRPDYKVFNTICDTTEKRQSELRRLAAEVQAVIVIGGRSSGNTRRLADVARESGKPVWHIETEEDLKVSDRQLLASAETVGISAGASTPNWVIDKVVQDLSQVSVRHKPAPPRFRKRLRISEEERGGQDSQDLETNQDRAHYFLQRVSRSFALTIPQLPPGLRERVANAYLMCRIIDTIEDETCLRLEEKQNFFQKFIAMIDGDQPADAFSAELAPKLSCSTVPAERELIREASTVVDRYFEFSSHQRAIIRRCLVIMADGMLYFQKINNTSGLPDIDHLSAYCYYVAGVVGEMLTDLFCDYSEKTARHRDYLFSRATSFGLGLQMTNILKDVWEDRERGACWLPRDVFAKSGCDLDRVRKGVYTPGFAEGLSELIGIAHGHLAQAMAYTLRIPAPESGMRKFCLWAIGMAVATLQNIHKFRHYSSAEEVKIKRRRLKMIILASNLAVRRDRQLKLLFRMAAHGLPLAPSVDMKPALFLAARRQPHW